MKTTLIYKQRKRKDVIYLGTSDFDKMIDEEAAFIDKTMFIKDWWEQKCEVSVILRPRRFGKSTNLSMLKSFFSHSDTSKDFSSFYIGKETEFIENHCGKYPVVLINMKGILGDNWEEMLGSMYACLRDTLEQHEKDLDQQDIENMGFGTKLLRNETPESTAAAFLGRLTRRLQKKYNQRVIVLIDEYDAPLNHAFGKGFHEKASSFLGKFYSNGLKDNPALKRACLVGIVEIRGSGIMSGLNNLVIYSSSHEQFSQYFGFTKEEISDFLHGDKKRIQDATDWYNGYYMGSRRVINPWSFMNYVEENKLRSYWAETANMDSICTIINEGLSPQLMETLIQLYEGNGVAIGELSTKVNYGRPFNLQLILGFLVHTGYLTYKEKKVFMPNKEIKHEWLNCSFGVREFGIIDSPLQRSIMNALRADPVNVELLHTVMGQELRNCSFFDTLSENSYHMFYFGIFTAICGTKATSNIEAGQGRYDIAIALDDIKRLFLFEFKHSKAENKLEEDAKDGLEQIHSKKYYQNGKHRGWMCIAIGVSFFQKQMSQLVCEIFQLS